MKKFLNGGFLFAAVVNYFLLFIVFLAFTDEGKAALPLAAAALIILYILALTPLVDWYYRTILNLREPDALERERLDRVWNMVCSRAEEAGVSVKESIRLYVSDEEGLNAFATGTRTIAVHRELLSNYISDEEIAGILAHELAHHVHGDTIGLLMSLQGTVIFGLIRVFLKVLFWLVSIFIAFIVGLIGSMATDGNWDDGIAWGKIVSYIMDKVCGLVDLFLALIAYLETMIFRFFDRQQEFAADEFGGMLGYADGLINFLRRFPDEDNVKKLSVEYLLYGTHPPAEKRIVRLQNMTNRIDQQTMDLH